MIQLVFNVHIMQDGSAFTFIIFRNLALFHVLQLS